jgi:hypothetical protein
MSIYIKIIFCIQFLIIYGIGKAISKNEQDPRLYSYNKILNHRKAVTYTLCGRFGDCLLAYLRAKWIAYKYNISFLYVPFPYSDQLNLHKYEKNHLKEHRSRFKYEIILTSELDVVPSPDASLIIVPYFPETIHEPGWIKFHEVDWNNVGFQHLIHQLVSPATSIKTIEIPQDSRIKLAIHVRKGGSVDPAGTELSFPLKMPPDDFYIAAVRKMSELCGHQNIYAYIFTDDLYPLQILNKFKEALFDLKNIDYDCRTEANHPGINVLEDFFSMQKFDCLIRPESNFSIMVEKMHDFKLVISPQAYHIEETIIIDSFKIKKID